MAQIETRTDCSVELVAYSGSDRLILDAMLISTKNNRQSVLTEADIEVAKKRINFLMANRHGTPFEHNSMTFRIEAPIAVFREWHRHRVGWSYNEVSGRYVIMDPVFYMPGVTRPLKQVGKPGAYEFEMTEGQMLDKTQQSLIASFQKSWDAYEHLLTIGCAKEVARGCLPVYLMSSMYATCNARSLMHFLSLRRKNNMNPEMPAPKFPSFPMFEIDSCAEMMEDIFASLFPFTYETYIANGRVAP